jgi:hypothetical protein
MPGLDRDRSLQARPVLNRLVRVEHDEAGHAVLHVPRKRTTLVKLVTRYFKLPPYRRVGLDELGTFVIDLCDGEHTVEDIVDKFKKRFKLKHREAELTMRKFLRELAERSIIGLIVEATDGPESPD